MLGVLVGLLSPSPTLAAMMNQTTLTSYPIGTPPPRVLADAPRNLLHLRLLPPSFEPEWSGNRCGNEGWVAIAHDGMRTAGAAQHILQPADVGR